MQKFDVIVIGQGYAGLTAAKLAHGKGLKTASVEAMFAGGFVMNVNELEPTPDPEVQSGSELISNLAMENMDLGIETISSPVTAIKKLDDGWCVIAEEGELAAGQVIVASGASLRKLGVPGEEEFFGRGVSECADCDGPMFGDMETVVVGGGDSAFQEALALTHFAEKVTILMRGQTPRARPDLVQKVTASDKVTVLGKAEVLAIEGSEAGVTGIRASVEGKETTIPCGGVFVFIGTQPNADFLPQEVSRDADGGVVTGENGATGQPGLWVIGAARSGFGGLLSDAAKDAERVVAALG